jgi:N-acetyl-anhydromuramyl-L-alanine amidase AmpD
MTRSLQHLVRVRDDARYLGGTRRRSTITGIVMHCTAGDRVDAAVGWMNRALGTAEGKASYHYLIGKTEADGMHRMAPVDRIAYHAGYSHVPPVPTSWWTRWGSLNASTIGIAWANDNGSDANPDDDELTPWQREAGLWLCALWCRQLNIDASRVWGHAEVAPGRKTDPLPRICDMDAWRADVARTLEGV